MKTWPTGWESEAITMLNIEPTYERIQIMRAWRRSTPLDAWTNNPIGMPASITNSAKVSGTGYALFPSMNQFYYAFSVFGSTYAGAGLIEALTSNRPYSSTWRTVSNLGWPGSATETDYPAKLLDLTAKSFQESVNPTPENERKTAGKQTPDPKLRADLVQQAKDIVHVVNNGIKGKQGIEYMIRRNK